MIMSVSAAHTVTFRPSGRGKAQCPPDPRYPNGIAVDVHGDDAGPTCLVELPYPAPECGYLEVNCGLCGLTVALTVAGRPDDPVSVRLLCFVGPPTTRPSA